MINTLILRNANDSCQGIDDGVLSQLNHQCIVETTLDVSQLNHQCIVETTLDEETTTNILDTNNSLHENSQGTKRVFNF